MSATLECDFEADSDIKSDRKAIRFNVIRL